MGDVHSVHLVLEAVPEQVDTLQDEIAQLWASVPSVSTTDRVRFEMALVEIFANIVEHSVRHHPGPPLRQVAIQLDVSPGLVEARFADDGRPVGLDLSDVTMPPPDAEDGRGLALTPSPTSARATSTAGR
jgi:serine/threonine-protein kinase RsbW